MNSPCSLDAFIECCSSYRIYDTKGVFDGSCPILANAVQSDPIVVVIDEYVDELYGSAMRQYMSAAQLAVINTIRVDPRESRKGWNQVAPLLDQLLVSEFPRHGIVVAIGGGVTLDIAGFAASIYRRGIRFIRVPTTLLGQVDVGIGIKQAINYGGKKSAIGSFHVPEAVINDRLFLASLDRKNLLTGVSEIVKIATVLDEVLFEQLEHYGAILVDSHFQEFPAEEVLVTAERRLLREITTNPFEKHLQRVADFGHTFSPYFESDSGFNIAHGEAVAYDMLLSTAIGCAKDACSEEVLFRLARLYLRLGLPSGPIPCGVQRLLTAANSARAHRAGCLNLVVPTSLGKATFIQEVLPCDLDAALNLCKTACRSVASKGLHE